MMHTPPHNCIYAQLYNHNLLMQLSICSLPIFNAHTLTEHFSGKLNKFEVSSKKL